MKRGMLILICLLFIVPFASAEVSISQPRNIYNMGDEFAFNATIIPSADVNDFFVAKIVCLNGEIEVFRTPLSLKLGSQKTVEISGRFDNFLTGDLGGTCHLGVKYGNSGTNTPNFEITRLLYVNLWTDKIILEPNERINASGKAIKTNGELVNKGLVELRISELNMTSFKTVEGGQFNIILAIPNNAPAKDYTINARVYEKDSDGKITNEGEGNTTIKVKQVIRRGEIAISSQIVIPENNFVYTLLWHDQANANVIENFEVSVYKPNGEIFAKSLVKSGTANNISIAGNFMPGGWLIKSRANDILVNRSFYVEEFENIAYNLSDGVLTVTNTGNVPYNKPVSILIGNASEIQEISVDVGETKKYYLSAPDGEYAVGVNDGNGPQLIGRAILTGRGISVDDGAGGFFGKSYILIWIMLISICALIAIQRYGRVSNRPYYGQTPQQQYSLPIRVNRSGKELISEGKREECTVVSLRIKNANEMQSKGDAMSAVERALTRARDARARVYSDKDYKTMIFAPSLTNEKENSMKAVSIAREIENALSEHNRRFNEKIMFGLGVHNGEMIIESSKGEFKFNSIGSTVPYAKKIAESASYGTGVSEMVHRKLLGKVKSERIEGTNYWRISKIRDREMHSEFIGKFVERQRRDSVKR